MRTCFVIQPFDRGAYDKRFEDILAPAIESTGLIAYRVDRDPRVSIPIDEIENEIRKSAVCLAEITTDNPNVWFELGYAIAAQKEVVLVCGKERTSKFPFDIQHRSIIPYTTDSPRDFTDLQEKITNRINAILAKEEKLDSVANISPVANVEGLAQHEIVTLVSIAENIDHVKDRVGIGLVRRDMERSGFTRIATTIGLNLLYKKGFINSETSFDTQMEESYTLYWLTDAGMQWLMDNQEKLVLRADPPSNLDIPF